MKRALFLATVAMLTVSLAPPTVAQESAAEARARIDRLERELRAVQRRVFPGAESGLVQPEVTPGAPGSSTTVPGSTPVADLTARIDAIEAQLARLTEQVEQTGFRQRELDAALTRLRTDLDTRIARLEPQPAEAAATTPAPAATSTVTPTPAPRPTPAPIPAATPAPRPTTTAPAPTPAPAPSAASTAARRAQVAAVEVPSTGDAPEDAYIYGFRLWSARLYPEAVLQLQKVITDYPNHRRASFAGNLMGRALLDNNQPSLAVRAFYDNYRNRPRGERAAESVYYMGVALIRLNRNSDACRTFDEFDSAYGSSASDALKAQVATARTQARC